MTESAHSSRELVDAAYRVADDVLFPAANDVDHNRVIPESHWEAIADAGLFGYAAPPGAGGPGLDFVQVIEVSEVMASGCLSTAFTWMQHHGVVVSLASTTNASLRERLLLDAMTGRVRAGVALAGVVPTPPRMQATKVDGGWRLNGHAPFVSGWGIVDILQIFARDADTDDVVSVIIPAHDVGTEIVSTTLDLIAANATSTASLQISDLFVADDDVVSRVGYDDFLANQNVGVRINGTLPFGVIRRAAALLDVSGQLGPARRLRERGGQIRAALDNALDDLDALVAARADAAQLAIDAAAALVAADGGRGVVRGRHPERLAREAVFLLVAASRPMLKDVLVQRFSA